MKTSILTVIVAVALVASGCNTTPTQDGAVAGGLLGAGAGAIIGNQVGKQGEGALIGAAAGALAGALIGDRVDENRRYDTRYTQPAPTGQPTSNGYWETRRVTTQSGETYEERVWVERR